MTEERRQHPRIPVRTIVKMQFATIGEFLQSYAQNISEGGMQLAVAQELQEGDRVGLEFKLKSDYPLIHGTAVVRWCRPSGNHYVVGVAFEELDERSRNTIAEAIALNARGGASETTEVDDVETIDVVEDLLSPPDEIEEVMSDAGEFSTDVDGDLIDELSPPDEGAVEAIDADEISIEEVSMDLPPVPTEPTVGPDLESLELPDPQQEDDAFEIEEVDLPAPPAGDESVADLFEDTEVGPEQLEFGTGFDATAADHGAEPVATAEAPTGSGNGGRKRVLVIAVAVLAAGAAGVWWLTRPASAPQVTEQVPLPDVVPPPQPSAVAGALPVTEAGGNAATESEAGGADAAVAAALEPEAEPIPEREPVPQPAVAPEPEVTPEPEPEPAAAEEPARRVVALLRGSGRDWLVIETDGAVEGHYRYFGLSKPPRAVVDLLGLQRAPGVRVPSFDNHPDVQRVRVGVHPDKIRLVFDLRRDSGFTVVADGQRLIVRAR